MGWVLDKNNSQGQRNNLALMKAMCLLKLTITLSSLIQNSTISNSTVVGSLPVISAFHMSASSSFGCDTSDPASCKFTWESSRR